MKRPTRPNSAPFNAVEACSECGSDGSVFFQNPNFAAENRPKPVNHSKVTNGGFRMRTWHARLASFWSSRMFKFSAIPLLLSLFAPAAFAQPEQASGEANLQLPDLSSVSFLGIDGHRLLMIGIAFCVFGLCFGLVTYSRLKNLPVHRSMLEISDLIYETCKTYLVTQGKFLLLLWAFIAVIIFLYFGILLKYEASRVI